MTWYIYEFAPKFFISTCPPLYRGAPWRRHRRLDLPDALGEADGQLPIRQLCHLQRRGGDDLAQRQRGGALIRQVTNVGPEELLTRSLVGWRAGVFTIIYDVELNWSDLKCIYIYIYMNCICIVYGAYKYIHTYIT